MIFRQWSEIYRRKKTQTRRVVKAGEEIEYGVEEFADEILRAMVLA